MERTPPKKLLLLPLLFLLSTLSFFRLFQVTILNPSTSTPLPPSPSLPNGFSLTPKEYLLLSNLISLRAPCNLLFFGLTPQFIHLSNINTHGTTIFLEDDTARLSLVATPELKSKRIHIVKYDQKASKAYELLKDARADPECRLAASHGRLDGSNCKLALKEMPREVYHVKWDLIVADGPSGDRPEVAGRMGVIYSAAVIARRGNVTDVVVHDVDRMIERWYSWEFLCRENLVATKGKLWHFRIKHDSTSESFCDEKGIQIV